MRNLLLLFVIAISFVACQEPTNFDNYTYELPKGQGLYIDTNGIVMHMKPKCFDGVVRCDGKTIYWSQDIQDSWDLGGYTITWNYDENGDSCIAKSDIFLTGPEHYEPIDPSMGIGGTVDASGKLKMDTDAR
jgi:hypothetical protein